MIIHVIDLKDSNLEQILMTTSSQVWLHCTACRILVPPPEIKPRLPALGAEVLPTGLPEKSQIHYNLTTSILTEIFFLIVSACPPH